MDFRMTVVGMRKMEMAMEANVGVIVRSYARDVQLHTFDQLCVIGTTNTRLMIRDIFCIYTNPANRLCTDHPQRAFILNEGEHVVERGHGKR